MKELIAASSHEAYMGWALSIPSMSREEEQHLGKLKDEHDDKDAARQLIYSHLKLVISIAKENMGYRVPMNDLIQEGNIGLMKAVDKFDYKLNYRLSSFAPIHILNQIRMYAIKNNRIMNVAKSKPLIKLFYGLRKFIDEHKDGTKKYADDELHQLAAEHFQVPLRDVIEMDKRMVNHDASTSDIIQVQEGRDVSLEETLVYDEQSVDEIIEKEDYEAYKNQMISDFLETLNERDLDIITSRKFTEPPVKFQVLSDRYGFSKQRVAQLEIVVIEKMKKFVTERVN